MQKPSQTRELQRRLDNRVQCLSFDRGFHSPENQEALSKLVDHLCLPKPGVKQAARQAADASEEFQESRQRHPGVESAIGALQRGNRLERCYDHSEKGFHRYVALSVLGRNLQVLGKLLIEKSQGETPASMSKRKAA